MDTITPRCVSPGFGSGLELSPRTNDAGLSPGKGVECVNTPCYALCPACDMLPNLPMRVRAAPWGPGRRTGGGAWSLRYR